MCARRYHGRCSSVKKSAREIALAAVKPAAWAVMIACFAFIAYRVTRPEYVEALRAVRPGRLALLALPALLYGIANYPLALAWALFVKMFEPSALSLKALMRMHLLSGIVKYLPGNVFHYAGRHALAAPRGVSQKAVLKANVLEAIVIVAVASAVGACALLRSAAIPELKILGAVPFKFALALPLCACGALALVVVGKKWKSSAQTGPGARRVFLLFAFSAALYLVFFMAAMAALVLTHELTAGWRGFARSGAGTYAAGFAIAWLGGFLVPGAPGGLGVREALLLVMLEPFCGREQALTVSLLFRPVTVAGDVIAFLSAWRPAGRGVS